MKIFGLLLTLLAFTACNKRKTIPPTDNSPAPIPLPEPEFIANPNSPVRQPKFKTSPDIDHMKIEDVILWLANHDVPMVASRDSSNDQQVAYTLVDPTGDQKDLTVVIALVCNDAQAATTQAASMPPGAFARGKFAFGFAQDLTKDQQARSSKLLARMKKALE
jgi:hypothetical protein